MSERKTIRKIFLAWDFEKEERWLNEMAEAGWALDGSISFGSGSSRRLTLPLAVRGKAFRCTK